MEYLTQLSGMLSPEQQAQAQQVLAGASMYDAFTKLTQGKETMEDDIFTKLFKEIGLLDSDKMTMQDLNSIIKVVKAVGGDTISFSMFTSALAMVCQKLNMTEKELGDIIVKNLPAVVKTIKENLPMKKD